MESNPLMLAEVFEDALDQGLPDSAVFDAGVVDMPPIRPPGKFDSCRTLMKAGIHNAEVFFRVDTGFDDAAEPQPERLVYRALLDMPAPQIYGHAHEAVIAEKFHAIDPHGAPNSRMKDCFGIWMPFKAGDVDISRLAPAIFTAFARQGLPMPSKRPSPFRRSLREAQLKKVSGICF